MQTDEYLYGVNVKVPEIPAEIIVRRVELLNDNLTELLEVHYLTRDNERVNSILKAIKHWENINGN